MIQINHSIRLFMSLSLSLRSSIMDVNIFQAARQTALRFSAAEMDIDFLRPLRYNASIT